MKWSLVAEIVAKAISPVTNAVLARLLIPLAYFTRSFWPLVIV